MAWGLRALGAAGTVGAALAVARLAAAGDAPALPTLPDTASRNSDASALDAGAVLPGSRVAVSPEGAHAAGSTFRWTQVEGPKVAIDDETAEKIRFVVPSGGDHVAFLVTVSHGSDAKTVRVSVPIAAAPAAPAAAEPERLPDSLPDPAPTADAGKDGSGEVGRAVKLDGSGSRAPGRVSYRWIAASGPAIEGWRPDGASASFVPTTPGTYRFALVVASGGRISEPDFVQVEVRSPESAASEASAETPLSKSIAAVVAPIPGGRETASQVADVFDAVAEKLPLYSSYAQLQAELTKRLDVVVPAEPPVRKAWSDSVFVPLSQITAAELAKAGVDARPPMSDQPLSPTQRDRLQELYRGLADACRPRPSKP